MSNPMPILAGTEAARSRAQAGGKAKHHSPLIQIIEMQDILRRGLSDPDTPLREAAQAACAWDKLEARKAILRGKPANTSQSIKSEPKQKRARVSGPVEPASNQASLAPACQVDRAPEPTPAKPLIAQAEGVDKSKDKTEGAWANAMGQDDSNCQV